MVLVGQAAKQSRLLKSNLARHDDAKCDEDRCGEGEERAGEPKQNKSRYQDTDPEAAQLVTLTPLLVGSEGTLAVVTEAELALVPRPKVRVLLVPHFTSLAAALDDLLAGHEVRMPRTRPFGCSLDLV